jgi:thimet oligopeptidase
MPLRVALSLFVALTTAPAFAQNTGQSELQPAFYSGITDGASLERTVEQHLTRVDALLSEILKVEGARTAANTLQPYDRIGNELSSAGALATVMARLHPDSQFRSTAEALARKVSARGTDLGLHPELYAALRAVPMTALLPAAKHLLEKELRDFRLNGADGPESVRARVKQLRDELQATAQEFSRNLLNGQRTIVASSAEAEGLPADFVSARADATGAVRLTTDDVDVQPVLMYARSAALRERLQRERWRVATPANVQTLSRMIALRHQLAATLGFPNWAEYHAQTRMANSRAAVATFIERVTTAARPAAQREYAGLLHRKQQDDPAATAIYPWDRTYYSELVRRASYNFDSQTVRPYLPYDRVRTGVLDIASRLFDVQFRAAVLPTWHPDVETFEVRRGDRLLGRIYLDVHPRAQKANSGASVSNVRSGLAPVQIPEIVLTASVPGGANDRPGLMTHDQVRTLFHEFGHLIHGIVGGQGAWSGLNGFGIEPDAVEAPSTMLEEWIWDPATLATFARHYQTGEPIPSALVEQMRRAGDFGVRP